VLVNNAGVFTAMPLAEVTAARVNELVATNLTAPSLLAAAALAPLREQGGSIIKRVEHLRPPPGRRRGPLRGDEGGDRGS